MLSAHGPTHGGFTCHGKLPRRHKRSDATLICISHFAEKGLREYCATTSVTQPLCGNIVPLSAAVMLNGAETHKERERAENGSGANKRRRSEVPAEQSGANARRQEMQIIEGGGGLIGRSFSEKKSLLGRLTF